VVLFDPPVAVDVLKFSGNGIDTWRITSDSDSADIGLVRIGVTDETLTLTPSAGIAILDLRELVSGGTTYLIAATVDAADVGRIVRWHDADGDGAPDASTEAVLLTTGAPGAYFSAIDFLTPETAYLYNARCGDVLIARDSDSDGWADTLDPTPFAMSSVFPSLLHVRAIDVESASIVRTARTEGAGTTVAMDRTLNWTFEDLDGDDVADQSAFNVPDLKAPVVYGEPHEGQTTIRVRGSSGQTVRLYLLDVNDDPATALGQLTLGTDDWEDMSLSPSLAEGDKLLLTAGSDYNAPHRTLHVRDNAPQCIAAVPSAFEIGGESSLTIHGLGLSNTMTVKLVTADGSETTLSHTLVSSQVMTVILPTLVDPDDAGVAMIYALEPGQDPEDGYVFCTCGFCAITSK